MSLLPLFEWLGRTSIGVFMQQSTYAFAIVEMVHLLSLTVLGGIILVVNLRVIGLGLKSQSATALSQQLRPILVGSLVLSAVSGVLLLSEETLKCYYNPAFRAKMFFLALALVFYFAVQERLFRSPAVSNGSINVKWSGIVSLLLWLFVGLAGRAIGFI